MLKNLFQGNADKLAQVQLLAVCHLHPLYDGAWASFHRQTYMAVKVHKGTLNAFENPVVRARGLRTRLTLWECVETLPPDSKLSNLAEAALWFNASVQCEEKKEGVGCASGAVQRASWLP